MKRFIILICLLSSPLYGEEKPTSVSDPEITLKASDLQAIMDAAQEAGRASAKAERLAPLMDKIRSLTQPPTTTPPPTDTIKPKKP